LLAYNLLAYNLLAYNLLAYNLLAYNLLAYNKDYSYDTKLCGSDELLMLAGLQAGKHRRSSVEDRSLR
jgi:hypothetical protein